MTREEQILQAARDYVSGVTLSSPSYVIHFEHGARWADLHPNLERLWHDAVEEPQDYPILCKDEQNYIWTEYSKNDYVDGWDEFVDFNEISKWAYISDLLPKGGEQ